MRLLSATQILVTLTVLATASSTFAGEGNSFLAKARTEIDAVKLEAARATLSQAILSGQNGPDELAEVHLLAGQVEAALGDRDAAIAHFRRALTLSPNKRLPPGVAPKISGPFEAAQAAAGSALAVSVDAKPGRVTILVTSDPLLMIVVARATFLDVSGTQREAEGRGTARIEIELPPSVGSATVAVLDVHGNRLKEDQIVVPATLPALVAADRRDAAPPPLYARWWIWSGAGLVFAAGGTVFALRLGQAEDDVRRLARDGASHDYGTEIRPIEERGERAALFANVAFGAAGACVLFGTALLVRDLMSRGRHTERSAAQARTSLAPGLTGFTLRF